MARKIAYVVSAILLILGIVGQEFFAGTRYGDRTGVFSWFVLLGIPAAGIASLSVLRQQQKAGIAGLLLSAAGLTWLVFAMVGCPGGIVAQTTAPDGTRMCVIETPGGESHQTGFYYQRPGKPWGWFYYEHEDSHWWFGRIHLTNNGSHAVIYRVALPVAEFDIPTESFTILRWSRTITSAQGWMPETWKPEEALKSKADPESPMQVGAPTNTPP